MLFLAEKEMQDQSQETSYPTNRPHDQIVIYLIKIQHIYEEVEQGKLLHVKDFISLRTEIFDIVTYRDRINLIKVLGPADDAQLMQDMICVIENKLLQQKANVCKGFLGMGSKSTEEYGKDLWGKEGYHFDRLLVIALKNIYDQVKLANFTIVHNEEIKKFIDRFSLGMDEKFYKEKMDVLNGLKLAQYAAVPKP